MSKPKEGKNVVRKSLTPFTMSTALNISSQGMTNSAETLTPEGREEEGIHAYEYDELFIFLWLNQKSQQIKN